MFQFDHFPMELGAHIHRLCSSHSAFSVTNPPFQYLRFYLNFIWTHLGTYRFSWTLSELKTHTYRFYLNFIWKCFMPTTLSELFWCQNRLYLNFIWVWTLSEISIWTPYLPVLSEFYLNFIYAYLFIWTFIWTLSIPTFLSELFSSFIWSIWII